MDLERIVNRLKDGDISFLDPLKKEAVRRADDFLLLLHKIYSMSNVYKDASSKICLSHHSSFGKTLDKHLDTILSVSDSEYESLQEACKLIPYFKRKSSVSSNRYLPRYFGLCRGFKIDSLICLHEIIQLLKIGQILDPMMIVLAFDATTDLKYRAASFLLTNSEHLRFLEAHVVFLSTLMNLKESKLPLPNLEFLHLKNEKGYIYSGITPLTENFSRLKYLKLSDNVYPSSVLTDMMSLKTLVLESFTAVNTITTSTKIQNIVVNIPIGAYSLSETASPVIYTVSNFSSAFRRCLSFFLDFLQAETLRLRIRSGHCYYNVIIYKKTSPSTVLEQLACSFRTTRNVEIPGELSISCSSSLKNWF